MFKLIVAFISLFVSSGALAEETTERFSNSDKSKIIIWQGEDYRGDGTYYLDSISPKSKIVSLTLRYGPMVNWANNDIAEIFVPYGSPFNYSLIYDTAHHKLSESFENLIAIFPDRNLVVWSDWESFIFSSIFDQKELQKISIPGLGGSVMAMGANFDVKIEGDSIRIGTLIEPDSLKELPEFKYFQFQKEF